jgi:hypothetical protein
MINFAVEKRQNWDNFSQAAELTTAAICFLRGNKAKKVGSPDSSMSVKSTKLQEIKIIDEGYNFKKQQQRRVHRLSYNSLKRLPLGGFESRNHIGPSGGYPRLQRRVKKNESKLNLPTTRSVEDSICKDQLPKLSKLYQS